MKSRTWTKDSIPFENFKIGSLQAVILISKVCLKPKNHTSKMG
jgi:ABC-type xylose transport system substrate-binding protein